MGASTKKRYVLSYFLIILLGFSYVDAECPDGSFPGINTRYHQCFQYINSATTWYDAEIACLTDFGGHLASIHSADVNDYVVSKEGFSKNKFLEQILAIKDHAEMVWLGAFPQNLCSSTGCGEKWDWIDGSDFTYSNFKNG